MEDMTRERPAIKAPGRSEARACGALLMAGAGLVLLSLVLPHPSGGNATALLLTAAAMFLAGLPLWFLAAELPPASPHVILAAASAATGLLIVESGVAVGQYGSIFVWATLIATYFYPRRIAAVHLGWLLAVYAIALALVESTAGYSPVTRWLFTAFSLTVVMLFVSVIVARRARSDMRARHFFDLSQDMLCTLDAGGRCVDSNEAWARNLGYSAEELQGKRLLDITHPDDHENAVAEAIRVFEGKTSVGIEIRVQAKDGSWHWLRSSSALAEDERLMYSRSTDITELKRIEAEREELLEEVESMAQSDALTGLPNRRTLEELLPREMARGRREESPLCVAILDIDHFKDYNDAHGHLAGDLVLRGCAIAWDSELRGSDTIVRFGGEEFLVVLPDCSSEQAVEIVERLRAVTPSGQTCSAGVALWDPAENVEDLIGRADVALYEAKEAGRDRLVRAVQ
jgi:diguanylate cyclase (GGDEF)-like protein/PAS domain S-box-containing protein